LSGSLLFAAVETCGTGEVCGAGAKRGVGEAWTPGVRGICGDSGVGVCALIETKDTKNNESDKKTIGFISTFKIETREKDDLDIENFFLIS
jgi:hypothetical protein